MAISCIHLRRLSLPQAGARLLLLPFFAILLLAVQDIKETHCAWFRASRVPSSPSEHMRLSFLYIFRMVDMARYLIGKACVNYPSPSFHGPSSSLLANPHSQGKVQQLKKVIICHPMSEYPEPGTPHNLRSMIDVGLQLLAVVCFVSWLVLSTVRRRAAPGSGQSKSSTRRDTIPAASSTWRRHPPLALMERTKARGMVSANHRGPVLLARAVSTIPSTTRQLYAYSLEHGGVADMDEGGRLS
jgi:hypothetical protein